MELMGKCKTFSFANERYIAEIGDMLHEVDEGFVTGIWFILCKECEERKLATVNAGRLNRNGNFVLRGVGDE